MRSSRPVFRAAAIAGALTLTIFAAVGAAQSGSWVALAHQPSFSASTAFLLTDGRVLCNDAPNYGSTHWWLFTPDANGSYRNGTWSKAANSNHDRLYFASGVFADGRVMLSGGEYSNSGGGWTNQTEIYDPVSNVWTAISPPPGWSSVGDAPNVITADGRFFIGSIFDTRTAFYNPVSGTWSAGPSKANSSSEATWILLPNGTVMTWDCFGHPYSEKWVPTSNSWVTCGNTSVDLVLSGSFETGGAILRPTGDTFCIGGPPATASYASPLNPSDPGTWTTGPTPPMISGRMIGAEDAPCAILPNGNVLMALGPVTSGGGSFESPTYFFEYTGSSLIRITDPPTSGGPPFVGRMLVLPTGEVMWLVGANAVYLYSNLPSAPAAWKPTVSSYPTHMERNIAYALEGQQFNGVSNGASYGDECYVATNYPLVRLTQGQQTSYCRTFGHSTMAVQTGSATVSTNVIVPAGVPAGTRQMSVVANGIPSDAVDVFIVDTSPVLQFNTELGNRVGGGLAELATSDDLYLVMRNNLHGRAQVVFRGVLPSSAVGTLGAAYECGATSLGLDQTLELWNWQTSAWESIDVRPTSTVDEAAMPLATGSVARFVGTQGEVQARITFRPTFALFPFQARIDRFAWVSGP
jgi:hypothetical protein